MKPFNENITKSIDNLNEIEKNINLVFGDKLPKDIDNMMIENVTQKSGVNINIQNTVQNGKFDWHLVGNCETIDSVIKPVTGFNQVKLIGKNLFNESEVELKKSWYGTINSKRARYVLECEEGFKYSVSLKDFINISNIAIIETYALNVDRSLYTRAFTNTFDFSHTTTAGTKYIIIQIETTNSEITQEMINSINLMFNVYDGDEISYQPYIEESFDLHLGNIELAAVDNYKDRIVGKPNDWKILKNVEKNSDGTYSILEITQEIPIIDATLNYELNHLYFNAIAYEGQTNIESIPESENATMIIDVDAFVTKKEE